MSGGGLLTHLWRACDPPMAGSCPAGLWPAGLCPTLAANAAAASAAAAADFHQKLVAWIFADAADKLLTKRYHRCHTYPTPIDRRFVRHLLLYPKGRFVNRTREIRAA